MFANRQEAGRSLAGLLLHLRGRCPLVLGLPRGGVVVAAEIAAALESRLDVLVVRKVQAREQPELALGAVTDGPEPCVVINRQIVEALKVPQRDLDCAVAAQLQEVRRRQHLFRDGRPAPPIEGQTVIVVDDGIATGATVTAGLEALRQGRPGRLILAVPVGPPETIRAMRARVEELYCLETPARFAAVGACYDDFRQTDDAEVVSLLREHAARFEARAG